MPKSRAPEAQSAGELDSSFGLRTLKFPGASKTIGEGVATTPSGHIMVSATVIVASGHSYYGLARLDADGNPDPTFGSAGYRWEQFGNGVFSQGGRLIVDTNGRILMCGLINRTPTGYQQVIARFKPDGSLDPEFGDEQTGFKVVPMRIPALTNAFDGSLVLAKSAPQVVTPDRLLFVTSKGGSGLLTRFLLDGKDDVEFAGKGWIHLTQPDVAITLHGVTLLYDGEILVHGKTEVTNQGLVMAFDSAGEVATSFGQGGALLLNLRHAGAPLESSVNRIVVQSAQRLLLIGSAVESSAGEKRQHGFVSGITRVGGFDPAFNGGAPVITAATQSLDLKGWSAGFALDDFPGPRIVMLGQTSAGQRQLLTGGFLVDGAVDPAFDVEGAAAIEWIAQDACLQGSSVLVLGQSNEAAQLVRLLTAAG